MNYTVTIWNDDPKFYHSCLPRMIHWANQNGSHYKGLECLDMSDISSWSGPADTGYRFKFDDEQEALMFSLKWI